jgi:hypothetical protein
VNVIGVEAYVEQVTKSSSSISLSLVGDPTELPKVDWPEVWFSAIEIGIIEGSLAGKVGLNAPILDIGT